MPPDRPIRPADYRNAPRYSMDAPVEFASGKGVTRDLSTTGVYFVCDTPLRAGARLSFSVVLDDNLADMPVRMEYEGTIVRIEQVRGKVGVAVMLDARRPRQTLH